MTAPDLLLRQQRVEIEDLKKVIRNQREVIRVQGDRLMTLETELKELTNGN